MSAKTSGRIELAKRFAAHVANVGEIAAEDIPASFHGIADKAERMGLLRWERRNYAPAGWWVVAP